MNILAIKNCFLFAKEFEEFDRSLVMASFDVKSLFTNIALIDS